MTIKFVIYEINNTNEFIYKLAFLLELKKSYLGKNMVVSLVWCDDVCIWV